MGIDQNQKLFSQISDLGRNISVLSDSIKKNTEATESLISKDVKTRENKQSTVNNENQDNIDIDKLISGLKDIIGSSKPNLKGTDFLKVNRPEGSENFSKIAGGMKDVIKAFQEGGVSKKSGKYLVGENGPEVVKLPKGSGVIPINIKDLVDGLKSVPELSDLIKDKDTIDFYGNSHRPSVVLKNGNKLDLKNLLESYEDKSYDIEEKGGDPGLLKSIKMKMDSISELSDFGMDKIKSEILKINSENTGKESKGFKDFEQEDFTEHNNIWDKILESADSINDLSVAKARLMATQIILDRKKEIKENPESENLNNAKSNITENVISPKSTNNAKSNIAENVIGLKSTNKDKGTELSNSEKAETILNKPDLKAKEKLSSDAESAYDRKEETRANAIEKISSTAKGLISKNFENSTISGKIVGGLSKKGIDLIKKITENKSENVGEATFNENKAKLTKPELINPTQSTSLVNEVKKLSPVIKTDNKKIDESLNSTESNETNDKTLPNVEKSVESQSSAANTPTAKEESKSTISHDDISEIKSGLARIASILGGTLTVSQISQPFRPDSRRI